MKYVSYRILVIGDSCIDRFQYGVVNRICPEAPVAVLTPTHVTENVGMAANVVKNLEAIESHLHIDFHTNKDQPVKTRYIDSKSNQMLLRIDENDKVTERFRIEDVDDYGSYDAVIVSDYSKGYLTEREMSFIAEVSELSFLDTKHQLGDWASMFSYIKVNEGEYNNRLPSFNNEDVIVTMGEKGAMYQGQTYATLPVEIANVIGAGDTFLAALVLMYLQSKDIDLAINYANKCSNIVVQKKGVSVPV